MHVSSINIALVSLHLLSICSLIKLIGLCKEENAHNMLISKLSYIVKEKKIENI